MHNKLHVFPTYILRDDYPRRWEFISIINSFAIVVKKNTKRMFRSFPSIVNSIPALPTKEFGANHALHVSGIKFTI